MKELRFVKNTGQGMVDGTLRVILKFLYFRYKDSAQNKQIIENFRSKGVKVWEGRGWIKIDLIGDNEVFKLGTNEYIVSELTDEEIEEILFNFYKTEYTKMGFFVEVKNG
jgi:hypothetical protein